MKHFFSTILLVIVALLLPRAALAHVLKTDGSIGAIMHVNPDDDPIVGESSLFSFEFKDKQNKFAPEQCDCTANVVRDGSIIFTTNLADSGFSYTFPAKAVYTIQVVGTPFNVGDFQPFTLEYDVRVDREPTAAASAPGNAPSSGHTIHYILFGGAFLVFFGLLFRDKFKTGGSNKDTSKQNRSLLLELATALALFVLSFHCAYAAQVLCRHDPATGMARHHCCVPQVFATVLAAIAAPAAVVWGVVRRPRVIAAPIDRIVLNNKSPPLPYGFRNSLRFVY